jgi:hypothetical protein
MPSGTMGNVLLIAHTRRVEVICEEAGLYLWMASMSVAACCRALSGRTAS